MLVILLITTTLGWGQLWRRPSGDDLSDLGSLPVRLHQVPHFGEVHGTVNTAATELAHNPNPVIIEYVPVLEQLGSHAFVLLMHLGKQVRVIHCTTIKLV